VAYDLAGAFYAALSDIQKGGGFGLRHCTFANWRT
jgi:hypothetical protein